MVFCYALRDSMIALYDLLDSTIAPYITAALNSERNVSTLHLLDMLLFTRMMFFAVFLHTPFRNTLKESISHATEMFKLV